MKKLFILGIISLISVQVAVADKVTFTFNFDDPVLKKNDNGYTEINFTDCWNYGKEGTPSLPLYGAKILLPQNQEISSIKILYAGYSDFTTGVVIQPAGKQVPFSKPDKNYLVIRDESVYKSRSLYPGNIISKGNTQFLSGHSIGLFTICPVIYLPADSMVKFLKEIKIEIETKTTAKALEASKFLRSSDEIDKRINKLVYNPQDISTYSYEKQILGEYDLLLISNDALMADFDEYVAFKTSTGYAIKTISVEDIYTQYTGADNQEKIRNCIIDYYLNKGIYYVILGGDADPNNAADDVIPHRGLTIDDSYGYQDFDIPSDEYYSCLDGNWNSNGNIYYGEVGEFDLLGEVSIGRICVDNSTEILNQTHKLFMYQDEPVIADIEKTLMVGEELGWTMTGSDFMHEIENGSSNYGYTTVGISSNQTINTLYETASYSIAPTEIYNQFNNVGANLINHLGHAYTDYSMKFYNADVTTANFQNDGTTRGYPIVYTQGCYSGAFDNRDDAGSYYVDDCIAENLAVLPTSVCAAIENSRYGWGDVDGTDGASQHLHRQFVDAIFGENITQIGDAQRDSKDDNIVYSDTNSTIRWCDYEATLFGDPTMDIWTATPTPITAIYASTVIFGAADISFQTDAPYGRIGLMQDGILIGRAITDVDGNAIVTLVSNISSVDTIFVSIIAHNRIRHKGYITVASPTGPYVVRDAYSINDAVTGNNNGVADYGEDITLSVTMKNIGIALADSVTVFISTTDTYVTITDSTEYYGDILPDSLRLIADGYALTVMDSIPDNHNVLFKIRATDGDTNWIGSFMISLKAPVLHALYMTISDPTGNNNGRLDPGETVDLIISSNNTGHSDALYTIGSLSCSSPYITLNNSSDNIGTLSSMGTSTSTFNITVSPSVPLASVLGFGFTVTSGDYSAQKTFTKTVGLVEEDWETGDFTNMTWATSGNVPWVITNVDPYDGVYSAKSGVIIDSQESVLDLYYSNVPVNDSVTFYRKVSSEAGWDYLKFYIDGAVLGQWSGEVDWTRTSYALPAGTHSLKWVYSKDVSVSSGSDCAWIDDIILPPQIKVPTDAWLYTLTSPVSAIGLTNAELVTVTLRNAGDSAISNIPVSYTINGGSPVTETYSGTINPNDSYNFTFSSTADLSVIGAYDITTYTSLTGDTIFVNDTLKTLVENLPEITCNPTAECSYGDMIVEFILNDLDHYDSTGCDPNGFGDHTNRIATLERGTKYELQASVGYADENLSLWIDFNDDLVFDANELLLADMNIAAASVLTSDSVQIPATAATGMHLMRVRIRWQESSADPCIAFTYGETHDYMALITYGSGISEQSSSGDISIYPNPLSGTVNILCSDPNKNSVIRIYNIQGQLLYEDNSTWPSSGLRQIDLSAQPGGIYYLEINNDNSMQSYKLVKY
jgi:hypothetical protein